LHRLFNDWLRQRYGSDEKLREAWRENVKLGEVRYSEHKPRGWDDLKFRDIQHFRRWLVERWVKANVQALRESGAKQPVTDEIDWKVCGDHYEASRWLDFVNLHYYGDRSPEAIATYLKFHDRVERGQGLAVGEFGARDHPSFRFGGWGFAPTEEVIRHFVNMPLLTFASGGAMVLNWNWKDMEACIFPWGLVHQHGIAARVKGRGAKGEGVWEVEVALKPSGKTFASVARVLEVLDISTWEPRKVAVVIPDEHLLGAEGEVRWSGLGPAGRISAAVFNAVEALLRLRVPFSAVREWELANWWSEPQRDSLPEIALFPVPFVWSDETYEAVKRFVERGGIAVITGDFTFDPDRKRTRTERLVDLLGLEFIDGIPSPFEVDKFEPVRLVATDERFALKEWWGKPCVVTRLRAKGAVWTIAVTDKGEPAVVARKIGKGLVLFCADAPEFRSVSETVKVYRALLPRALELKGEKEHRIGWVLGGWVGFDKEQEVLAFGNFASEGWIFITANTSDKKRDAHFFEDDYEATKVFSRLTMLPQWVGFLAVGTHYEPSPALFVGDFWGEGPGYRRMLLGSAETPVLVWSDPPYRWIGYLPMGFVPLRSGIVKLFCVEPSATLTVCDLVTGKVLLSRKVQGKDGWLQFDVPPELVLTEWRLKPTK